LPSKVPLLRQIGNRLPGAFRFRPAADLASEIEWARNRRIGPERYLAEAGERTPPIPADLMARVYRDYESAKRSEGVIDFEDLLELAIGMFENDDAARATFQAQ